MNNRLRNISSRKYGYGFSLIELMVALVIGMLVTLVISQTLSVYEGRKRTTSGTADAQTSGSLALYALQRDAEMAGFAMPNIAFNDTNALSNPNYSALKCNTTTNYTENTPIAVNTFPVTIVSGVDSDVITIRYGNSPFGGIPTSLLANFAGNIANVDNTLGCKPGDSVLIIPSSSLDCLMTKIPTFAENGNNEPIATNTIALTINSAPPTVTIPAKLFCLGAWNESVFSISSNKLLRNGEPVGNDIIAIKAQYGISGSATDNKIVDWVDGTFTDKNRIKSIRVALLARNNLYEKDIVTNDKPTYFGGSQFNLSGDWGHYRYRVFETIVPLRNVVWSREAIQ
ncbi:type IV pilus assembly protein PilW [Formivibrio citricus]|uniref:Type IV pilus assembly protein PilW n=1 Tax=Formivibrio citricus TaxID=83765 RepID=A0A1I4ZFP6_9NEIS|nr:PilW family protein [Formivibrio citricus]SFN48997.1 type IV pilus assembly protein PilW [Formivibrio citricus]